MDSVPSLPVTKRHGGFGIASFVISMVLGVGVFILIVVAGVMEASTPGGVDENSPQAMILGLLIIGALLLVAVGVIFGCLDFIAKEKSHLFAILGIIFNVLIILGTVGLMILGIMTGK